MASEIKELLQDLFTATQILVNEKVLEALGLITTSMHGRSLAESPGKSSIVLMRGHGATVVGSSIKEVVFRSIYATTNAQIQPVAIQLPYFLSAEEGILADELHNKVLVRAWDFWKSKWKNELTLRDMIIWKRKLH